MKCLVPDVLRPRVAVNLPSRDSASNTTLPSAKEEENVRQDKWQPCTEAQFPTFRRIRKLGGSPSGNQIMSSERTRNASALKMSRQARIFIIW